MEFSFNPYVAFGRSVLAGFIMSMGVGGGGILAGIGHISILGIGDPNMIKVVNQILAFASRIISVPLYHRQKRLVWPLAISYGIGAPIGAVVGSWFSKAYLSDMSVYRPVFGIMVALVAARVLYEGWAKSAGRNQRLQKARETSQRAQHDYKNQGNPAQALAVPRMAHFGWWNIQVRFAGEEFGFNPVASAAGGFIIAFVSSTMGVGGGFLVSPFMASVLLFPMFLVVGTSLVALMLPLMVSVATYLLLQVHVDWTLVLVELPGVLVGSFIGPTLNRYMNEKALKTFVAIVLLAIGIYYIF